MKTRELAATLKLLKQFDVASYSIAPDGAVSIAFRDARPPEPVVPVAGMGAEEELPEGVLQDIRGRLADINRRAAERS